jgi:formate/nitrite transporter FocA (FNT family)
MLLGANVSLSTWWFWNQIPVTLGNLVGGMVFTGLAIYYTHGPAPASEQSVELAPQPRVGNPAGYPASF